MTKYYITTNATRDFVNGRYDIVRGTKGSGKTTMLIAVQKNQEDFRVLNGIKLLPVIQLKGDPEYVKAFNGITDDNVNVDELRNAWEIFFINTIWKKCCDELPINKDEIKKQLEENRLISPQKTVLEWLKYALKWVKPTLFYALQPDGTTKIGVDIAGYNTIEGDHPSIQSIDFNSIFQGLDEWLEANKKKIWILLDRLDDAFPSNTPVEKKILKSLLLAYKDICLYENYKLKIFIREDIFEAVTDNGFTSLTHVSAKTMPSLGWEQESIEKLLVERLLHNESFVEWADILISDGILAPEERQSIIFKLVKPQIDTGKSNPDSIGWVINHLKDGKGRFTPRDFLSVFDKARNEQLRRYRNGHDKDIDYLISPNAIRTAIELLSKEKLETELYAEYPKYKSWIEKFKGHKAEHSEQTLEAILGTQWKSRKTKLVEIGFIEEKGKSYKIPYLYRPGLDIKQGKEELGSKKKRQSNT